MDRFTATELESLPTLAVGQTDDLKVQGFDDEGQYRVWLARTGVEDGEPYDNRISVERPDESGSWHTVAEYRG